MRHDAFTEAGHTLCLSKRSCGYEPVRAGQSPDIGRKRPYTIGDLADVETARRMYPYITPHHAKTKGESMGFAYCLGHV